MIHTIMRVGKSTILCRKQNIKMGLKLVTLFKYCRNAKSTWSFQRYKYIYLNINDLSKQSVWWLHRRKNTSIIQVVPTWICVNDVSFLNIFFSQHRAHTSCEHPSQDKIRNWQKTDFQNGSAHINIKRVCQNTSIPWTRALSSDTSLLDRGGRFRVVVVSAEEKVSGCFWPATDVGGPLWPASHHERAVSMQLDLPRGSPFPRVSKDWTGGNSALMWYGAVRSHHRSTKSPWLHWSNRTHPRFSISFRIVSRSSTFERMSAILSPDCTFPQDDLFVKDNCLKPQVTQDQVSHFVTSLSVNDADGGICVYFQLHCIEINSLFFYHACHSRGLFRCLHAAYTCASPEHTATVRWSVLQLYRRLSANLTLPDDILFRVFHSLIRSLSLLKQNIVGTLCQPKNDSNVWKLFHVSSDTFQL